VGWKRWVWGVAAAAAAVMLFLSGSRGSIGATLLALLLLGMRAAASGWLRRLRLSPLRLVLLVVLVPALVVFLLQHHRLGRMAEVVVSFLALNNSQRGLGSGLSGRAGAWYSAFHILGMQKRWLFGFGYRTGEGMVIDNGYIDLLFESGLISGTIILGSFVRVFALLWRKSTLRASDPWNRFYLLLWLLMPIYFLNNISARYLLSVGNSFSLLVLMLASASRRELTGGASRPSPPPGRR
jgi:O-antigen ligase